MDTLEPLVIEFDGHDVRTFVWNGRATWIAREIALAIGYGHLGRRLIDQISGDWADDFIPGFDYDLLSGDEAAAFTGDTPDDEELQPVTAHGVFVLYESGLHLVLSRTNDAARRLRLHLLTEVLSALPEPDLDLEPERARSNWRRSTTEGVGDAEHALDRDLDDRKFRVATLHRTADLLRDLGRLDDDQRVLLEVSACEIALGFPLIHLYPPPVREAVAHALGVPVEADSEEPVATAA